MRRIFCILLLAALALPAAAQPARFNWEYDADFRYIFDNREFADSNDAFVPSGTMNTIVLAPTVGFSVEQSPTVRHRLMAGVELANDMGSHTWADFAREPIIYYNAHVRAWKGTFDAFAGIFSRNNMEGAYGEAFFSGMFRNSDRNIEGVLLKWRAERFYAELGLDWMDVKILRALTSTFRGRPVGLTTLASALSEEPDTLEDVYEPFLMQQGLMIRTPKGRQATARTYEHIGMVPPERF